MSWQTDKSRHGLLATESDTIPTSNQARGWRSSLQRWQFTRYQKVLISLVAAIIAYVAFSSSSTLRHDYLHLNHSKSKTTAPTRPKHNPIHDARPPPWTEPRVRMQKPMPPFEHDVDDINPTMRTNVRKALVIASHEGQKLDWLQDLNQVSTGWQVYRYIANKPDRWDSLNVGREAGVYLQYIVDNYNNLSDYTIFTHGHDRAWHQPMRLMDKITTLNWTAVDEEHYINLRCTETEGCTDDTKYYFNDPTPGDKRWGYKIGTFWSTSMRPQIGHMPKVIGRICCAQFAVDKAAILHRPLVFYERLLEPLLYKNLTELKQYWGKDLPEDRFATLFEMTWHIIFGKPADHCPGRDRCNAVHFQNYVHCDKEVDGFKNSDGWEKIKCRNDLLGKG